MDGVDLDALATELARATFDPRTVFSLEADAAGHQPQLKLTQDQARYIIALCSRRAGKTRGIASRILNRCRSRPDQNVIYVALTKTQARMIMWEPIWKPLVARWGIRVRPDESLMTATFPNGSRVRFTGTDDVRHIETELGAALDEAIIDESQAQSVSVLDPLIERILPPALGDRAGTLLLAGTVPEVEAGSFLRIWNNPGTYSRHNWSLWDNPHFKDPEKRLAEHLAANPALTKDSPIIQREWFGRFVFDSSRTAYKYDPRKNSYAGDAPGWLNRFAVGIDPGTRDRTAVVLWGWGPDNSNVYQVYEWVTPRYSGTTWGDIARELRTINERWHPAWMYYDAGSSQMTIDTFGRDYGLPVIPAAKKADLPGQVAKFNDLLVTGRAKIRRGSALEEDLMRTRWDMDARERGAYKWSSHWHPDVADAGRYGLQAYYDAYVAPGPGPDELQHEADMATFDDSSGDSWYNRDMKELGLGDKDLVGPEWG